jgi:hypothetical protein
MTTTEMEQSYTLLKLSMLVINTLKIGRYNRAEPPNYIAEMKLCMVPRDRCVRIILKLCI